jgi:O-antigen/teichoic acid export membrane protein
VRNVLNRWWHRNAALAPRYSLIADQAVVSGTTFLTNIFIARLCGLATFGAYSGWQLVLLLVLTLQSAVITQPMQLLLGLTAEAEQAAYRRALGLMQVGFGGLAVLTVALGLWLLGRPLTDFAPFAVLLLAACAQDTARKLLLADGRAHIALLSDSLSGGLQLLWLAAWSLSDQMPSVGELLWVVGLTTLPAVAVAVGAWRLERGPWRLGHFLGLHARQARWLLPTAVLQWAVANGLLVVAGIAQPPATLGILRLAQTVMGIFSVALQAVENDALPRLSRSYQHDRAAFGRQLRRLARTLVLGGAPVLLLLFLAAEPVVRWLQPDAVVYVSVLHWCCALYLVILLVYPLRLAVRLVGQARPYFIGYAISLGASLLAARPLVTHWPITGVVMGWLLAQLVLGAYWLVVVRKDAAHHRLNPAEILLNRSAAQTA